MPPLALLALVGVGVYLISRGGNVITSDDGNSQGYIPLTGSGGNVYNRENARGVHPALQDLLDAWEREGWFDVVVAAGGGLRTAADQAANVAAGLTKATDITKTPHGRGGALDIHPYGFDASRCFKQQDPIYLDRMNQFGQWAKTHGFVWGGDWSAFYSPACQAIDNVRGDRPHVEIANWPSLPYPPPNYFSPV